MLQRDQRKKGRILARCMLWPGLIGVVTFYVFPFFLTVYYSVLHDPFEKQFVGLDNYRDLLQNAVFRLAVRNTVRFSALAVPLAVGLALGLALALERRIPGKSRFRTALLSPLMAPIASVVLIWKILFHQNGTVNRLLATLSVNGPDWLYSSWGVLVIVLLFLWKNLGYDLVLFMAAISHIPAETVEAARIDGAGAWRTFWCIKWRYLLSTTLFVSILTLANSFKVFREVYMLSGNYPYEELYMLQHFMNNMFRTLNYPYLSAATVLMTLVIGGVLAVLFYFEGRAQRSIEE